jgi:hypothetical protein
VGIESAGMAQGSVEAGELAAGEFVPGEVEPNKAAPGEVSALVVRDRPPATDSVDASGSERRLGCAADDGEDWSDPVEPPVGPLDESVGDPGSSLMSERFLPAVQSVQAPHPRPEPEAHSAASLYPR